MKRVFVVLSSLMLLFWFSFAQEYVFFYGNGCSHCAKVENFFAENDIESKYDLEMKEIYFNRDNLKDFQWYIEKLWIDSSKAWVPFLVIDNENECEYVAWDKKIIEFFQEKMDAESENFECNQENCPGLNCSEIDSGDVQWTVEQDEGNHRSFFGVMIPAALADSINPCAFAVILLLLSSILIETKDKKKAILAWFLFALAVFLSYLAMWLGLFSALASATNTAIIKRIVWILGIIVWLANMKDFFRYWEWFRMEVPLARRPTMHKVIKRATSPIWAFIVWFLVSLFLLPCTSGPYITILWYLASESNTVSTWWLIYLIVYNLIFVLPMILITLLVWLWVKSAEELAAFRHKNIKLIHLIVWLLMLGLWIYVLVTM